MKVYSTCVHWSLTIDLINGLLAIFKANQIYPSYERLRLLQRYIILTEYVFKYGIVVYALAMIAYIIRPLAIYLFTREIVVILPMALPFVDDQTMSGYVILLIFHASSVVFSGIGSICIDYAFAMIIMNVHALPNLFDVSVKELNVEMNEKTTDVTVIKAHFRNILLQRREYTEY